MVTPKSWLTVAILLLGVLSLAAGPALAGNPQAAPTPQPQTAQPPGTFSGSTSVTSISMIVRAVDAHGKPVTDLTPNDITVLEDGKPVSDVTVKPFVLASRSVRAVAVPSTPVPAAPRPAATKPAAPKPAAVPVVTIYFQNNLLGRGQIRWATKGLRSNAKHLTGLGPVRIVVADPAPHIVADGITSPAQLKLVLKDVPRKYPPHQEISRLRRQFNRDLRGALRLTRRLAAMTARQEEAVIRRTIERLQVWAAAQPRRRGRILLVVSGGFDLNPYEYYSTYVHWAERTGLNNRMEANPEQDVMHEVSIGALFEQVSQELAGLGWTVVSFTGGVGQTDTTSTADVSGNTRFETLNSNYPAGMTPNQGTMLLHPNEPLSETARASGGALAVSPRALTKTLQTFTKAYLVAYTVARPPDGNAHRVRVTPLRAGIVIHAPTVVRSVTKAGIDRNWALSLLDGQRSSGGLTVAAKITDVSGSKEKGYRGKLIVKTNMASFMQLFMETGAPKIRMTIAADFGRTAPFLTQWKPRPLRLSDRRADWVGACGLRWPAKAKSIAVVVSETATDIWGGAVIALPHPR